MQMHSSSRPIAMFKKYLAANMMTVAISVLF